MTQGNQERITSNQPNPQEFIVTHRSEGPSTPSKLDKLEKIARIFAIFAIPVLVAFGGWYFQDLASKRSVDVEYVIYAVDIINLDEEEVDPRIRNWAVDLWAGLSPLEVPTDIVRGLKSGDIQLPARGLATGGYHYVQPGETLFSIARSYGTTIERIMLNNPSITNPNAFYAGTWLFIPAPDSGHCPGNKQYLVEENETLATIADEIGVSVEELININGFGPDHQVNVMEVICIP